MTPEGEWKEEGSTLEMLKGGRINFPLCLKFSHTHAPPPSRFAFLHQLNEVGEWEWVRIIFKRY